MKLIDLIDALATEIESVQPLLQDKLSIMHSHSVESVEFMDALDSYTDQVTRMGEAFEMAGFDGLQSAANHVLENVLLLAGIEDGERTVMLGFMSSWAEQVVHYLRNMQDPSCAAGLVDVLRTAPSPMPEDRAMRIMHQLGKMNMLVAEGAGVAGVPERQTQATAEDVALVLPDDLDPMLMEGFYNEAGGQARELVDLVSKMAAGTAELDDIVAAKRVVHTLKGSGAIIGLRGLASLGHHFEDVLEHFERKEGQVAERVANVLLDSAYCLEQMVDYVMGSDGYPDHAQMVLQNVLDLANKIDRGEDLSTVQLGTAVAAGAAVSGDNVSDSDEDAIIFDDDEDVIIDDDVVIDDAALVEDVAAVAVDGAQTVTELASVPATAEAQNQTPDAAQQVQVEAKVDLAKAERELTPIPPRQPADKNAHQHVSAASAGMRVATQRIEELFRVSAEVSVHSAAMETRIKELTDLARDLLDQNLRVKKRLLELETVVDVRALNVTRGKLKLQRTGTDGMAANDAGHADGFDPLEMDQYNELHSTAHALAEDSNDAMVLSQRVEEGIARLHTMQTRQQVLSRDLQHLVMTTRMAEVGTLEPRLKRNVRNTCQITGKKANLVLQGHGTQVDSELLSKLAEPLLHVLRNAVDHGIESPQDRVASGKSEAGLVVLDFSRQGQQVVMRCIDDGRGLDYEKIYQRGVERGLIDAGKNYSEEELAQLILQSGFSTRDVVSEVSGRGVGMDVVRDWVSGINGSIRVYSTPGKGSTVEMRFAASLSTVQSLVVEVENQRFALPSVHIEQALSADEGEYVTSMGRLQFHHKQRVLAASRLSALVGLSGGESEKELEHCETVLMRTDNGVHALAVDKLVDSRELLVQALDRYTRHVQAVSGTSILGDGSIAVHVDVPSLLAVAQNSSGVQRLRAVSRRIAAPSNVPKVLVVDDSLAVRNTLQELVEDAGYKAITARDGLDAINMLNEHEPKLILTDLEMPNMNGVELTRYIRARDEYQGLPIIMVTSRSQEKHRQLAKAAGVDDYMTKPYNEVDLLSAMRSYVTVSA